MKILFSNTKKLILVLFIFFLWSCGNNKEQKESPGEFITDTNNEQTIPEEMPAKMRWINDSENLYTAEEKDSLNKIINEYEIASSDEIYILTVKNINPYEDLTNYSDALFNVWKPGKKEKDNGLVFVISRELGELRMVSGSDIEKKLSEEDSYHIINNIMIPAFMNSDYYAGTKEALQLTIQTLEE